MGHYSRGTSAQVGVAEEEREDPGKIRTSEPAAIGFTPPETHILWLLATLEALQSWIRST
jgi:hypothetical protein